MMETATAEKERIVEAIQDKADGCTIKPFILDAPTPKSLLALGEK